MRSIRFVKMQGTGNDYVYVNCFEHQPPEDPVALAKRVSRRRFGIGADGLILILPSSEADARMRMFNADGSEAEMCGNGLRCVAKYLFDHGICRHESMQIETGSGVLSAELRVSNGRAASIRLDMGEPLLRPDEIPVNLPGPTVVNQALSVGREELEVTCVSMGNPHCVIFVDRMTDELVSQVGPQIESHVDFPNRTNVEFVVVQSSATLKQRTWERGSGETLACGTGACAVGVAGVLTGKSQRRVSIQLLGGELDVHWDEADNHVYLEGPAEEVFEGEIRI